MSKSRGYVFIHGAWHNSGTWAEIKPRLERQGHLVRAVDLPGAGPNASEPASLTRRPFDKDAFATEPSPNADVTQRERTDAVIAAIREINSQTGGKAILVGHSLGGLTVSHVAEEIPEEIGAVVYLTAMMLPSGMSALEVSKRDALPDEMLPSLICANPNTVGAMRLNTRSEDPAYRARMKECFYGDVDQETFDRVAKGLHCDEPAEVRMEPSPMTAGNFGTVPRHYIECTEDNAIPIYRQRFMVKAVDAALGSKTTVHTLRCSHSPFASIPDDLGEILLNIR